jgi:hypothetical protein
LDKDDEIMRKSLLNQMVDFGFGNLAKSLDEELYNSLQEAVEAADQQEPEQ